MSAVATSAATQIQDTLTNIFSKNFSDFNIGLGSLSSLSELLLLCALLRHSLNAGLAAIVKRCLHQGVSSLSP